MAKLASGSQQTRMAATIAMAVLGISLSACPVISSLFCWTATYKEVQELQSVIKEPLTSYIQ